MAGKHEGGDSAFAGAHHFQPRLDRAYAEGRESGIMGTTNPHTSGTDEFNAWLFGSVGIGVTTAQFETAYVTGS